MTTTSILDNLLFYENNDKSVKALGHYINADTINVTIDFKAEPGKSWNLTMKKPKWFELRDKLELLMIDIDRVFE